MSRDPNRITRNLLELLDAKKESIISDVIKRIIRRSKRKGGGTFFGGAGGGVAGEFTG